MKTFLINLDQEKERLAAADAQLKRLGIAYERIPAVYGKGLSDDVLRSAINRFRWWCAIGWPVSPGQIGCAMSHYAIYRRMIRENIPVACIFEDDVLLDERARTVVDFVEAHLDENKARVVLLSDHTGRARTDPSASFEILGAKQDLYAEGYVLTLCAARELLKANWPMQVPCDHWKRWVKRGAIELFHAYPTVCSQNRVDFEGVTVPVGSPTVAQLPVARKVLHKFKRGCGLSLNKLFEVFEALRVKIEKRD